MNEGDYISFDYMELVTRNGVTSMSTSHYSGYITRLYKNGQFLLNSRSDEGQVGARFERLAMR